MQIFTPLIVKIEILRSLSRTDRMAPGCGMTSGATNMRGANSTETSSTSSNSSTMCRSQKPCTGFCTTPSGVWWPRATPPRPPPTDKERIAHAKKLYYAAQANMTPEREEELRSYFHKLALPYNQHLGAVWMRLGDDGIPYVAFPASHTQHPFHARADGTSLGRGPTRPDAGRPRPQGPLDP